MSKNRDELYADLFQGTAATTVTIGLLEEEVDQVRELVTAEQWEPDEALHTVFAAGLAYLRGERTLRAAAAGDQAAELERLLRQLMACESRYAVMKYRAFTLQEEKQTLAFKVTGLEGENRMGEAALWRLQREAEERRAELERVRAEAAALRERLARYEGATEGAQGRWGRLVRRLRRRW
jgi:chromosome segregation ATPase